MFPRNMLYQSMIGLVIAVCGVPLGQAERPPAVKNSRPAKPKRLVERIVSTKQGLTPLRAEEVQAVRVAMKMLAQPTCAAAVGGRYRKIAQARLVTAQYFKFTRETISAEQEPGGKTEVIYALSSIEARRVL